jgi:phosphoribosyl-ATP pyrophosphohydrolase
MTDVLDRLMANIVARQGADPASSYVASVFAKGCDHALKKVGEEAAEFIVAAKGASLGQDKHLAVKEAADLWFHSLIALAQQGLNLDDIKAELARREGVSGHQEKASRPQ